jgi:hypothetical protein
VWWSDYGGMQRRACGGDQVDCGGLASWEGGQSTWLCVWMRGCVECGRGAVVLGVTLQMVMAVIHSLVVDGDICSINT